ncbi:MAG: ABC transporter permease, partial [Thermodesulfobacteriota bacterium]
EGLEMQGIPTFHFLCIPRLVGVSVAVICLIILFDLIAIAGGFFAAWTITGVTVWDFLYNLAAGVRRSDFLVVLTKGLCFGVTIPVVCLYHGFQAAGAITTVPPQVSKALVECLLYCVVLNIMISFAFSF